MRDRVAITILILSYLVLATTYSLVTPLGEGPDEPGHAKYVFFLARTWQLPVQCAPPCENAVPGEGHQPPLAYLLATPALLWMPQAERSFDLPGNRSFVWAGGTAVHAVAHGTREYWPWRNEVLAWHLARLINVAIGSMTVLVTFLCGRQLCTPQAGFVGAALIAFNPQFLFTAGLLTNDTLLTTLSAILLWLVVRATSESRSRSQSLAVGVTLGLALITKQSALLLMPIAAGWCILAGKSTIPSTWQSIWPIITRGILVFGTATLLSGWWYLRNLQLYGDLLGLAAFKAEFITQRFEGGRIDAWVSALITLHESYWARFGWMNVAAPIWAIWFYTGLVLLGGIGIVRGIRYKHTWVEQANARIWPIVALPLLAFVWLVSFALTAGLVAWQGRLLFPALPALAIALGYGLVAIATQPTRPARPTDRGYRGGAIVGGIILVGLAIWMPFGVIRPTYPFQTLPVDVAEARLTQPVYARYAARADERGAALRNVKVVGVAQAGNTVQVQLIWNALGRQNRDWWVFVHLVDQQEQILTEDNREPRDGAFPMTQWVAGDWIESTHPLILPPSIPPGMYRLRIGLWYPKTERRAGYFDAGSKLLGDYLELPFVVNKE